MKLLVVARAAFVFRDGAYYGNSRDGAFLDGLAQAFDVRVLAVAYDEADAPGSSAATKHHRMTLAPGRLRRFFGYGRRHASGLARIFTRYVRNLPLVFSEVRAADVVFVFMPMPPSVITLAIAKILRKRTIAYLGADWGERAKSTFPDNRWGRALGLDRLYVAVARILEPAVMRRADVRLVRGRPLYDRYKGDNRPLFAMVPITNFDRDTVFWERNSATGTPPVVLYVGRLTPLKAVDVLIESIAQLSENGRPVELHIVGSGPERDDLQRLASERGLGAMTFFRGYVSNGPQLVELYRRADVFVLPSRDEGLPRVIFEAMSQAVPVVATSVGGVPQAVRDGAEAVLVPPGEATALSEAICQILDDDALRERLIDNGRRRAIAELGADPVDFVANIIREHFDPASLETVANQP